jgi:hypothetical protein
MFVRILNALLGLYLFVAAFFWPQVRVQFLNVLLVGVLTTAFGLASILGKHHARKVSAGLGFWLFLSGLVLPSATPGALFNQIVCAVLLVVTALWPAQVHYQEPHPAA